MGSEQEHVSDQTFDREILVQRSDGFVIRLGDDRVVRVLRNRAAGGDRGETRAAPALDAAVHPVAMQQRTASAARGCDAFGEHLDDRVEILARKIAVGISGTDMSA